MSGEKITEFLVVLVFALVIGTGVVLTVLYLSGVSRNVVIFVLLVAALTAWQFLRKRFGRV